MDISVKQQHRQMLMTLFRLRSETVKDVVFMKCTGPK